MDTLLFFLPRKKALEKNKKKEKNTILMYYKTIGKGKYLMQHSFFCFSIFYKVKKEDLLNKTLN